MQTPRDEKGQFREKVQTVIDRDLKSQQKNEPLKPGEKVCPECGAHIAAANYAAHIAACNGR